MTRRLFVDTAVLLYAVGGAHEHRAPCRAVLASAASGDVELHASVELLQEFLFHRLRRTDRATAVQSARDVRQSLVLHPFDATVADTMLTLVAGSSIGGRDAVHAATALDAGFTEIVSTDSDLDGIVGLTRLSPAQAQA